MAYYKLLKLGFRRTQYYYRFIQDTSFIQIE